jgi:hypothetical protein
MEVEVSKSKRCGSELPQLGRPVAPRSRMDWLCQQGHHRSLHPHMSGGAQGVVDGKTQEPQTRSQASFIEQLMAEQRRRISCIGGGRN